MIQAIVPLRDGGGTSMLVHMALGAGAGWLVLFAGCVLLTARPPAPAGDEPEVRPALVNLVISGGRLGGAAYPATILDLASRGQLVITEPQTGFPVCELPARPAAGWPAAFEQLVLADARGKLASGAPVPFAVLAESCAADVPGLWHPFEEAVRRAGRERGLTRARFPAGLRALLLTAAAATGLLAGLAVAARPHEGLAAGMITGFFAAVVPAGWAWSLGRQDRLTRAGVALAAQAAGDRLSRPVIALAAMSGPELSDLAVALAAGAPVPLPGADPGRRAGVRLGGRRQLDRTLRTQSGRRPQSAWSSFSGEWRLVPIEDAGLPLRRNPLVWASLAAWCGLVSIPVSMASGPTALLIATVIRAAALLAAVAAVAALMRWLAQPSRASFNAQVIARWVEDHDNGEAHSVLPYIAVDDGQQAWSAEAGHGPFSRLQVGDVIRVQAAPRSRRLVGLEPAPPGAPPPGYVKAAGQVAPGPAAPGGQAWYGPAPDGQAPSGPAPGGEWGRLTAGMLLSAAEVGAALGAPVRGTALPVPRGTAVSYRGEGLTVLVTLASGVASLASLGPARHFGLPLSGTATEGWLLNQGRTVVLSAGDLTAKISIGGRAGRHRREILPALAETAGRRLDQHVHWPDAPS